DGSFQVAVSRLPNSSRKERHSEAQLQCINGESSQRHEYRHWRTGLTTHFPGLERCYHRGDTLWDVGASASLIPGWERHALPARDPAEPVWRRAAALRGGD